MPVHIVMPDVFLFLFQLAPGLCTYVFADGLAILIHANLYATTVLARRGFLRHDTPSLKGRGRLCSVLGDDVFLIDSYGNLLIRVLIESTKDTVSFKLLCGFLQHARLHRIHWA